MFFRSQISHRVIATEAVRRNVLTPKATDKSIETEIKVWLKFVSKRLKQKGQQQTRRLEPRRANIH